MTEAAPLLTVKDLRVSYTTRGTERVAVSDVSFTIGVGEVVAIVGESGSGKTTTAHAIIRLLAGNARIEAGEIEFDRTDLSTLSRAEWRELRGRRIGLIPQDPAVSLNPLKKVGGQVAEVLRIHRLASRRRADEHAVELLALAGIPDAAERARQYPHQFSGGMKQRALIATALAADPQLVIADEPTSALDVTVQRQILDHIDRLTTELGTAVLLITHDLGVAGDRADRIIVMQHGRIVESGTAARVLGAPEHEYTRALVAAAPGLSGGRWSRPARAGHFWTRGVFARNSPFRARADRRSTSWPWMTYRSRSAVVRRSLLSASPVPVRAQRPGSRFGWRTRRRERSTSTARTSPRRAASDCDSCAGGSSWSIRARTRRSTRASASAM
jgi:ABC-type glutathione transport system ATPase component